MGSRLRRIGDVEISYDRLGSRPSRLGARDIGYDMAIEYDQLGSRLIRIGDFGVAYDMVGSRVREIGGFTVDYDMMGSRPRYLRTDGEVRFDETVCAILFLVLVAFADE